MENKIRINSGTKKIEVNDQGEYIMLPLADDNFVVQFYKLMESVASAAKDVEEHGPEDIQGNMESVEKIVAIERETKRKVDDLFGADTCRKVFGDILPSMDLFVEFFGSIVPFMEAYKKDRLEKMRKYGADRTGSAV